jgi:hypothetical protein
MLMLLLLSMRRPSGDGQGYADPGLIRKNIA